MGRGKRRKRSLNPFTSDDDSSGSETKTWKQDKLKLKIPAAPLPPSLPAGPSSLTKSLSVASMGNIAELTVVTNMKQGKRATVSPAPTAAGTNQKKLVQKIINLRQQAAEKAQQWKKAMSLRNIHKLSVTKETVDSTLCCEVPVKVSEAFGNRKSALQSSSIVSPLNTQSVEQSSSDSSEKSNDIQFCLPQSLHRSLSTKTENPCLCPSIGFSTSDCTHQTPLREFSEFVATEDRSKRDTEPDEVLIASLQTASTSTWPTDTAKFNNLYKSLKKLDQKVDNMRAKLDVILINQSKINRVLMPEEKVLSKPSNMPALPLDTVEHVTMFGKFISNDVNFSDTCYYLKSLPLGNNEARAVSKLMSHLITNSLAQEFNFDGHGTKLAFKSTKLWELMQGTLLMKFEESDLSEALTSLRSWLRNVKGRKTDNLLP